jgi:hypothetical protein
MTGLDETPLDDAPARTPQRQSRYFWTTAALSIVLLLLLCTVLIVIAATRS